jgi:hypothetical protein
MRKQLIKAILIFLCLSLLFLWGCVMTPTLTVIYVSPKTMLLSVGGSQTITSVTAGYATAPFSPVPLTDCSYSSDNPGIATVSDGVITGIDDGTATVTISYTEGGITMTDTIEVTVTSSVIVVLPVHNITQDTSYITIQDALNDAKSGDTIEVYQGTYHESLVFPSNTVIILESTDGPDVTTIKGLHGKYSIACNGCPDGTDIRGFTITHQSGDNGTGIYNTNGSIKITNCQILDNGSSIMIDTPSTPPGGGIWNVKGNLTIFGSTVSGNSAAMTGGGIKNDQGSLQINGNTIITDNTADNGGGIYNYYGETTIAGKSKISLNEAEDGGGIYNDHGTCYITGESSVYNNQATYYGGGICNNGGTTTVTGLSTVSGNEAYHNDGGGIYNTDGDVTITNGKVKENSAWDGGGGIYNKSGMLIITQSTINGNWAHYAGGIYYHSGSSTVKASTISENGAIEFGGGMIIDTISANDNEIIIGGNNSNDTINFNEFINNYHGSNDGSALISPDEHINNEFGDPVDYKFPYNNYTP